MKQKLLLICIALLCAVGSWAYTGVEPAAGRTYFLYNVGANAYFVGTSTEYRTDGNIANATPVTVEASGSNFKLAFVDGGTTYRIAHEKGGKKPGSTSGVDFWWEASGSGYELQSKPDDYTRSMNANGDFPQSKSSPSNVTWQFIACEEAMTHMSTFCAGVAEANYVQSAKGWERVTSISELQTNPEDYFFAIFSANAVGLIVDASSDNAEFSRPYYKTAADPLSSSQYLFEIENYEPDGFALKSCGLNNYFGNNSDSWNFQNPSEKEANCKLTITLNDGAYRIQSANADWGGRRYWGLYDYTGYTNGQKFAGNKNDAEKGSFLIYRIAKENLSLTDRMNIDRANWEGDTNTYLSVAMESYNGDDAPFATGDVLTQTISNLPNGIYEVEFYAWENFAPWNASADIASGDNIAQVIANEAAYDINVLKAINDREWNEANTYTLYCSVTDGTLKYGVKNIASGGNWAVCRPISLTYLISSLPASLTGASGKMNNTVVAAQTTAIEAYNAVDGQTPSNYAAAIEAIANAEASIAAYDKAKTYLESVEAVLATTNFYTSDAYNSVYDTYKSAYDAGTLDDATAAGLTYKVASWEGTQKYDTNTANDLLIPGWTIGSVDATTTDSRFYINTWSHEDDRKGFDNPFYEYWVESGSLPETTLAGTISDLTANATYAVTANVRVQGDDKVTNSIRMQVGSGTTVDVTQGNQIGSTSRYVKSYTAVGSTDGSGNLTLTFTVDAESQISWLSFRDVRYEKLPSVTVSARAGKYGTVIFPFTPDVSTGFDDIKFYSCASVNNGYTQIEEVSTPAANTPYIIKNNGVSDFSKIISGFSVAEESSYTVGLLTGVYTDAYIPMSNGSNSYYVLQTKDDVQAFYKVEDADFPGTPYKCYLTIPAATPVKAFLFPENPTEINAIEAAENENTEIYNLAGQRLSKAQKGVNIVNGKKVLVK